MCSSCCYRKEVHTVTYRTSYIRILISPFLSLCCRQTPTPSQLELHYSDITLVPAEDMQTESKNGRNQYHRAQLQPRAVCFIQMKHNRLESNPMKRVFLCNMAVLDHFQGFHPISEEYICQL